jgi:hypothetical protein
MTEATHQRLMAIKQSFRFVMDGTTSRSMASKGAIYKINWGVPFHELRKMAQDYRKDYDLAVELWKEDIRECKILATLIMPPERMSTDLVDVWMEQPLSQEMAEMLAFNLYQYLSFAPALAYRWMAVEDVSRQICAYHILARLFMRGQEPNERGADEYLDQVDAALHHDHLGVRRAASASLQKFALLGEEYAKRVTPWLQSI